MKRTMLAIATAALVLAASSRLAAGSAGEILFLDGFEGTGNAPQFVPVDDQAGVVDVLLEIDIDTSEPASQAGLQFSLDAAPQGMTIRADTGEIDWTPEIVQVGTNPVTVRVEDLAGLANTLTFDIEVVDPNAAPLLAPIADQGVGVGDLLSLTASATVADPSDPPVFSLDQAPAGMTLDPASGLLEWLPTAGDVGSHPVTVRATDGGGRFDTEAFTASVAVNAPPVLEPMADRGAAPEVETQFQPVADDPDPGDTLSWSLPERPPGMTIDPSTGLVRWTPTPLQLGPHPVTVAVRDALGAGDEASFEIFVDHNRAPVAVDDPGYRVERGDTLSVPAPGVLGNDTDPNSDPLTTQLVTGPQQGALTLDPDGGFEYTPDNPAGTVDFELKWEHRDSGGGNMFLPLIANLDDDPASEIVIYEGGTFNNELIALDGATGEVDWKRVFQHRDLDGGSRPAVGDIDLDGRPEILIIGGEPDSVPTDDTLLYALEHHGGVKWVSEPLPRAYVDTSTDSASNDGNMNLAAISLADLDGDGIPEIIVAPNGSGSGGPPRYQVWDAEGRKLDFVEDEAGAAVASSAYTRVEIVDLDLDGDPEIVVGSTAWSHTGEFLWRRTDVFNRFPSEFPVVANIDDDPFPELIRRRGDINAGAPDGNILAWNHDGSDLWEVERDFGFVEAPITVADVDVDGLADILLPGVGQGDDILEVLNGADGSVKWSQTVPFSDHAGATAFDLDRDGFNEVVFLDNASTVHVWDGRDGAFKASFELLPGANRTPQENTVVLFADVDADGQAELVTPVGSAFTTSSTIRIWESPNDDWAPMRSIWNQQRYYVTNVNDDLTIPSHPRPPWLEPGLNRAMVNERLPEARVEESDFFDYTAFDGELTSNVARVDIAVLPPNAAPRILSSPKLLASPGFEYVYPVLAVDSDPGETLTLEIGEGPPGMFVDAQGLVRWTPDAGDLGVHVVVVEAVDSIGARASQNYLLEVVAPVVVPDLSGRTEAEAVADLEAATLTASPILDTFSDTVPEGQVAAQDPAAGANAAAGSDVRVEISQGPVPVGVPRLVGLDEDDALAALADAGLSAAPIDRVNDPGVPLGVVASQDPPPNAPVAPGSDIAIVVSGGPRAVIAIDPPLIPAGDSATVAVEVRDTDGTPLDPQPEVTLSIQIEPDSLFGTAPALVGDTITTGPDTQGEFAVEAAFDAGTPETVAAGAAVLPAISEGPGGTVYTEFVGQLEAFGTLVEQLAEAIDLGDGPAIEALDTALADLEDEIDVRRLRTMTPMAPDTGMLPSPAQAIAAGLGESIDDSAYGDVGLDLLVLLEEIDSLVRAGTVPDLIMNMLNQELAAAASAKASLEPSALGVLRAQPEIVALLGTFAPRVLVADIRAVRQALRDAGIITADGTAQAGRFTLPGILSASQIRRRIITNFYVPYLGEVARMMGVVIAADAMQTYFNAGAITGIVTGASQSIHAFNIAPSVIEGFGFDPRLSPNNAVTMIGPALFEAASTAAGGLQNASSVKDVNSAIDFVQDVVDNGNALQKAWDEANSTPMGVARGCILDGTPGCRQLIYPNGFTSVYEASGLSLPGPVLIITRNLESGSWAVFVANFVPTEPEE